MSLNSGFVVTGGAPYQLVYDSVHGLAFATNPELNEVDVISVAQQTLVARISVPQPIGLDLFPGSSTVVVGTALQTIYLIDPVRLQVTQRIAVPAADLPSGSSPAFPIVTAAGKVLLLCVPAEFENESAPWTLSGLLEWDPASGAFTDRSAMIPLAGLTTAAARSGDHGEIIFGSAGAPGSAYLYDSATDSLSPFGPVLSANILAAAANANGSQFALLTYGGDELDFLSASGVLSPAVGDDTGPSFGLTIAYSADGSQLFTEYSEKIAGQETFRAFDAAQYTPLPQFDAGHEGLAQAATPDGWILATGPAGILLVRVPAPAVDPSLEMALTYPAVNPGDGTDNAIMGGPFLTGDQAYFGSEPACSFTAGSSNSANVIPPPAKQQGPVNVTVTSPSGWFEIAADAYSYGPTVQTLDPSAGPPQGGNQLAIYGFGLNYPAASIQVSVGGAAASVDSAGALDAGDFLGTDVLVVTVPPGTPGWAEVRVTTPDGGFALPNAYQYLQSEALVAAPEGLGTLLLDPARQELFATAADGDQVQVFSTASGQFLSPIALPGAAASDMLSALELTPDDADLVVGDYTAQSVEILDPDQSSSPAVVSTACVNVGLNCAPLSLAATSTGQVFITTAAGMEELDLATLAIRPRTDAPAYGMNQPRLARTADGSLVFLGGYYAVGLWSAQTDQFTSQLIALGGGNAAISADGDKMEEDASPNYSALPELLNRQLAVVNGLALPDYVASPLLSPGAAFDATGALVYVPNRQSLDVFDSNSGTLRLRVDLPQPPSSVWPARIMAVSPDGKTVYLAGQSDLEVLRLAALPLGIGEVTPAVAAVAGGTSVQITGTGLTAQTAVSINGTAVGATLINRTTLQFSAPPMPAGAARIVLQNPDGEHYALDAALQYQ